MLARRHSGRRAAYSAAMLGPFDWYSVIEVGIAAAVVCLIVLIGWLQGPPRN
jgi:hypothetical protein